MRISIVMTILIVLSLFVQVPKAQSSNYTYVIPDESIRLRILAHSDEESDQRMKLQVRDKVNQYISEKIFEAEQIDDARIIVQENISELEQLLTDLIERPLTIEYHSDVYFPEKVYGQYIYPEDMYEAVLITIGDGVGENWWCVLFPPLCYVDLATDTEDDVPIEVDEPTSELDRTGDENLDNYKLHTEDDENEEPTIKIFFLEWLGWS